MAEVLGVVSSGIAVAGLAGQMAKQAIVLKQLWDEIRDVPESIRALAAQLDLLQPILADMETSFLESPEIYSHLGTARQSLEYCHRAIADLAGMTEDLGQDINSARWIRKSTSRLRIVLKKDRINVYRERLQNVLQLLGLSQQIYLASLIRAQPRIMANRFEALQNRENTRQCASNELPIDFHEEPANSITYSTHASEFPASKLPWSHPGYLGGIFFASYHQECRGVYEARIQLPFWLASRTWDVNVRQACSGWRIFIRPRIVRPFSEEILHIIKKGSSVELFRKLIKCSRSIHDCDETGNTLLHVSVSLSKCRRFDIALELVRQGARLDERNMDGFTPFSYMCIRCDYRKDPMPIFRFLASTNQLEDLLTQPGSTMNPGCLPAIEYAKLRIPGLFHLINTTPHGDNPCLSWANIAWHQVDTKIVTDLLEKQQAILLREIQTRSGVYTSVCDFVFYYFICGYGATRFKPSSTGNLFEGWRALCRCVFRGATAQDITIMNRHNTTLLMALLYNMAFSDSKTFNNPLKAFCNLLRLFLQDLKICGVDLDEYGRNEMQAWQSSDKPHAKTSAFTGVLWEGPLLANFTYGAEPKDWTFELDHFTPEYARDFWDVVEAPPPPPPMPGAWVEDA